MDTEFAQDGSGVDGGALEDGEKEAIVNRALPEFPAIDRRAGVRAIRNNNFTAPFLPSHRTTADGRVAVGAIANYKIWLNVPEKLKAPFASGPAGTSILASEGGVPVGLPLDVERLIGHPIRPNGTFGHRSVCDATSQFPGTSKTSPVSCGSDAYPMDCYRFTIVVPYHEKYSEAGNGDDWRTEVWGTRVTVRVTNPKTRNAKLHSITYGTPVRGLTYRSNDYGDKTFGPFAEPMFTNDGRLLVFRTGYREMPWVDDRGKWHPATRLNIVYSVAPPTARPCDVRAFRDIRPIAYAPYDSQMRGRYGIADYRFRDPEGKLLPPDSDFPGTYPWVDRAGSNIMFESISARLHYVRNGRVGKRYPTRCADGTWTSCNVNPSPAQVKANGVIEWGGNKRGVSIAGRWTHGKIVLLDGLVNNTDYAFGSANAKQRQIELYTGGTGPGGKGSAWVNAGVGHDSRMAAAIRKHGVDGNANIVDSLEQLFNYREAFVPHSFRDVVWLVTSGHTTAEVAFDDYIDPNAFIVAEMTPSQTARGGQAIYHDGFDRNGVRRPIRMQNAATAPGAFWKVPSYGRVEGGARAEPIAMGGIEGKGLWLDGNDSLVFDIPASQPTNVLARTWTISIFIDPRFADDRKVRRLLTYPDGTTLDLVGRRALRVRRWGTFVFQTPLPGGALPARRWSQIGLKVSRAGAEVGLFLNGMRFDGWRASTAMRVFRMRGARLTVGGSSGAFRGWIDDFKVLAHNVNPEHMCNLARGTLIGLRWNTDADWWWNRASRYPAGTHNWISTLLAQAGRRTFPRYACFHNYSRDLAAHRRWLPSGAVAVGEGILFPEGPLVVDEPRPGSWGNSFCRTCHTANSAGGLSLAALVRDPDRPMQHDRRRQPMQPPRRIYGRLPKNFFERGVPSVGFDAPQNGFALDRWVYAP